MKIILSGYGDMNQLVADIAEESGHEIVGVYSRSNQNDYPTLSSLHGQDADLVIDFSHPNHLLAMLEKQLELPIVVATTGQKDKIIKKLEDQSNHVPVFFSANMSYGIHVLTKILEAAVPLLESYDIELIEAHHNKKVDAPSGTLVQLLETITSYYKQAEPVYNRHDKSAKRNENEIGIHTLRAGSIVGDHEVLFAGEDESIQLIHKAGSKSIFARGAIKAGEKLIERQPGFYTFNNL